MKPRYAFIFLGLLGAASCRQENPYAGMPGSYHSHTKWNGNDIRIELLQDSSFKFIANNDRGLTYCSAGNWRMQDSFLLLKAYDANKKYDLEETFPELKGRKDVLALQIDGKFIVRGNKLYNLDPQGNKVNEAEYYDKVK